MGLRAGRGDRGKTLTRIDRLNGNAGQVLHDFDLHKIVSTDDSVWAMLDDQLVRFHADTTHESEEVEFDDDIVELVSVQNRVWVLLENNTLVQMDATAMQPGIVIPLDFKPDRLTVADDWLWLVDAASTSILQRVPETGQPGNRFIASAKPVRLFHSPDRLWVLTEANTIDGFDTLSGKRLITLADIATDTLVQMYIDGETLWFADPEPGRISEVQAEDGHFKRQFTPCVEARNPYSDGVHLWLACPREQRLILVPLNLYFVSASRLDPDMLDQQPLIVNSYLWLVQEAGGTVVVYDGQRILATQDFGAPLLPLQVDNKFVWTATRNGTLIQMRGQWVNADFWDFGRPRSYKVRAKTVTVTGEIQSFHSVGNRIWVLHSSIGNLAEAPNVSVFNRNTLDLVKAQRLDTVPTSFTVTDDAILIGASGRQDGWLYRLDPVTGELLDTYDLPETVFAPWAGAKIASDLWFTAGAPPVDEAAPFMVKTFVMTGEGRLQNIPGLLSFDTTRYTWDRTYEIPPAPMRPVVDAPYLWFTTSTTPVLGKDAELNDGTVFAVDVRSGKVQGPWLPCQNVTTPFIGGAFVWVGCSAPDQALWAFNRTTPAPAIQYEQVGSRPWAALEVDGLLWVTFRDTWNAAVFDAATGELRQVYHLSQAPGSPFLYQGQVQTHLANGVLQTLYFQRKGTS